MNIDVYNNWSYDESLYDYKRGDLIELLNDRFIDYGWNIGRVLTIGTVYNDGDVYAIDEFSYGKILKPGDFKLHKMLLGDTGVSIKIVSNIIPDLVRSHMVRYEKDKALFRSNSSIRYYKDDYSSSYSPVYSSNSKYCNVNYYSSDNGVLNATPKVFYTIDTFLSFCDENDIIVTDVDKKKLSTFSYAHCYYDSVAQSLVYATTYRRLKELYDLFDDSGNNSNYDKLNDECYMIVNAKDTDYKLVNVKYNENNSALTSFMFECGCDKAPYLFKTRDDAYRCKTLISNRVNNCIIMSVIRYKDYFEHTS